MAKWERFIVYPLLLVALFLSVSNSERVLEATESVADEIRARRIVVVGEDGQEKAVMDTQPGPSVYGEAGRVTIYDSKGTMLARLDEGDRAEGILALYADGKTHTELRRGVSPDIGGTLRLFDAKGKQRAWLFASEEVGGILHLDDGAIAIQNAEGAKAVWLYAIDSGGGLDLYNSNGDDRVSIGQTTEGHGGIWVYDKYGEDNQYYGHR